MDLIVSVEVGHEFVSRAVGLGLLDVIHHFGILLDHISGKLRASALHRAQ